MFTIRELNGNEPVHMEYQQPTPNPRVICDEYDEVVAYLWAKQDGNHLYVKMIEVVRKQEGLGTEVVEFLFKKLDLETLSGNLLIEPGNRAFWFWSSLGSYINVDGREIDYVTSGDAVHFTLSRESLFWLIESSPIA